MSHLGRMRPYTGLVFISLTISLLFLGQGSASDDLSPDRGLVVLSGTEPHTITTEDATRFISNFRRSVEPGSATSEMFSQRAIKRILDQRWCVGVRISYARRDDGTPVLVLSGVDQYGADLPGGEIAENGIICPPVCGFEASLVQ